MYEQEPESVLEIKDYKILRDFSIQTDHDEETGRPDMIAVDKKDRSCKIIDFEVLRDSTIGEKEKDEIEKKSRLGNRVAEDMEC